MDFANMWTVKTTDMIILYQLVTKVVICVLHICLFATLYICSQIPVSLLTLETELVDEIIYSPTPNTHGSSLGTAREISSKPMLSRSMYGGSPRHSPYSISLQATMMAAALAEVQGANG